MSKWSKRTSHNDEIWSWMKFKTGLTSIAFGDLSNFLFLRSRAEMDIESQAWLYKLCKGKVSKIISQWKGKAGKLQNYRYFSLAVRLLITDVVGSTNTCFSNKNHFSNLPPLTEMHKYLRLQISIDLQKNDCKICRKDMTTLQKRGKLRDETQKCWKVVFIGGKPGKIA